MGNQRVRLQMSVNSTSVMVHSPLPSGHIISEGQKCFYEADQHLQQTKPGS